MIRQTDILPKSRIIRVSMEIVLPCDATREQIDEWIAFETGARGDLPGDNPLDAHDLEAVAAPVLTDTGLHLHEAAEIKEDGPNQTSWHTHRWTTPAPFRGRTTDEIMREYTLAKYKQAKDVPGRS